ncbi:unnamed protein product [Symbiodinium natans]|uniref:Uncharacterized protein n=1 Tax=Symbiodinium natans TaxID=878477 RepID=A0A812PWR2_9DINO|nr:unnamed protein product [Symbiodinium natans]
MALRALHALRVVPFGQAWNMAAQGCRSFRSASQTLEYPVKDWARVSFMLDKEVTGSNLARLFPEPESWKLPTGQPCLSEERPKAPELWAMNKTNRLARKKKRKRMGERISLRMR